MEISGIKPVLAVSQNLGNSRCNSSICGHVCELRSNSMHILSILFDVVVLLVTYCQYYILSQISANGGTWNKLQ